jgi:hypothetical protein
MPRANVTTLTRFLLDWADKPANVKQLHEGQIEQIEAALPDPRRTTQLHVASWMLGTFKCGRGQAGVLRGEAQAFDELRTGIGLMRCALLLRERQRAHDHRGRGLPNFLPLHGAHGIALCLAFDDPRAEQLYAAFRALPDAFFGEGDWPLFVRELLALRAGERPAVTQQLGPWHEVLMHWQGDPALLARRLADLLDLHLDATSGPEGTFEAPPVRLLPVEVLAVAKVRAGLGLVMPRVDHPLMFTNLVTMQPRGPWPEDPLLARIERALRRR